MIIEIKGDDNAVEAIQEELTRAAGAVSDIKKLEQKAKIEIRDIDIWSTKEDVADSITRETGVKEVAVINFRPAFGTMTAVALLSVQGAKKVVEKGYLKVGFVSSRARWGDMRNRCPKCLVLGHSAGTCTGKDRSSCCRRCGEPGHYAVNCKAETMVAASFRKELEEDGRRQKDAQTSPK